MRKAKRIYKLYGEGASKRRIRKELGISRNTVAKYIEFFKCYRLTPCEVSEMTLEEIHRLFKADQKPKSEQQGPLLQCLGKGRFIPAAVHHPLLHIVGSGIERHSAKII
ncbi:hypothetical protein [Flagellimonas halotolerans]